MKKSKFQLLLWIFFYIMLFALLLNNSFSYLDPDFGWHIKIGEQILTEKAAPRIDYYNYTVKGAEWVDHEWLFNAALSYLYDTLGYFAINILFALLVLVVLILITWFSRNYFNLKKNYIILMSLQLLGILAMLSHLGVRMQEIALLFLLLELIILEIYNRNKNPRILLCLTPLYLLWTNLHGSYLIGLFLIFIWLLIKYFENKLAKKLFNGASTPLVLSNKELIKTLPFFLLAAISTLATPYGIKLYTYLSDLNNNFYAKHITEWFPIYVWPINYYKLIYIALLTTFIVLFLIKIYYSIKNNKTNELKHSSLFYVSIAFLFLILSIKSKRHFPLLFIVSFPLLACQIKYFFSLPAFIKKYFNNNILLKSFILAGIILPTIYLSLTTNFTSSPFDNPKFCENNPCRALEFIQSNEQYRDLKIFNNYNWGGYLLWNWPNKQIFIDGRMPQYNLGEQTLLREYYDFFDPELSAKKLEQYGVELILIRIPQTQKPSSFKKYIISAKQNKTKYNTFINYLNSSPRWRKVYTDNVSIVYAKQK